MGSVRTPQSIEAWGAQWFNPFVAAVHGRQPDAARTALDNARRAVACAGFPEDEQRCLEIHLAFYEMQRAQFFGSHSEGQTAYDRLMQYLAAVPAAPQARQLHAQRLLATLVIGEAKGWGAASESRIRGLLDRIDESGRGPELWHYVSAWSFAHGARDLLEQAFAALTVQPGNFMASAGWKRVNLMYLLLERRAGERDVLEYLKDAATLNMLREFSRAILPVCEEQGLATPAVLDLLGERLEAFEANPPVPSERDRPLRGMRGRL